MNLHTSIHDMLSQLPMVVKKNHDNYNTRVILNLHERIVWM